MKNNSPPKPPNLPKPPISGNERAPGSLSESSVDSSKSSDLSSQPTTQSSQQSKQERVMEITGNKPSSIKKIKQMSKFSPNTEIPLPDLSMLGIEPEEAAQSKLIEEDHIEYNKINIEKINVFDEEIENDEDKHSSQMSPDSDASVSSSESKQVFAQIKEQQISPVGARKIKLSPVNLKNFKPPVQNDKPVPEIKKSNSEIKRDKKERIKVKPKSTKKSSKKVDDPIVIPKLITKTKRIEFGSPMSIEISDRNREYVHMEGTGTLMYQGKKYSLNLVEGREPSRIFIPSGHGASFECTNELEVLELLEITFIL